MHKLSVGLIGGGVVALVVSIILGWLVFPQVIRTMVNKSSRLEQSSVIYKTWENPGEYVKVYLKIFIFNVTNPNEFARGAKPEVAELGPYVYRERRRKKGIEVGELPDTLRYRQKVYYNFEPEMSAGSDNDMVTFLNIPFVAVASMAAALTDSEFVLSELDSMLVEKGEGLFRTNSVRELLFDGFTVQTYVDILSDPIVEVAVGHVDIPPSFNGGTFALYKGKNGSADGLYEVKTGVTATAEFGMIYKWNNCTELPWHKPGSPCSAIKGTDGTLFPPDIQPGQVLEIFSTETCRSMELESSGEVRFKGIPGLRFSPTKRATLNPLKNKENQCFCPPHDPWGCQRNGLIYISSCRDGAPVTLSGPHFLAADSDIISSVMGMNPVDEQHKTVLEIEPVTGTVMRAAKRLQFNVDIFPVEFMPSINKVRKITFPIMWAEEAMELPENLIKLLSQLHHAQEKVETARWSMIGVSLVCLCLGIMWVASRSVKVEQLRNPDSRKF